MTTKGFEMQLRIGRVGLFLKKAEGAKCLAFSTLLSKGWFDLFLFLYFVDVEISWRAKDWMLRGEDEVIGGRTFQVYTKNPKYIDTKFFAFMFPR